MSGVPSEQLAGTSLTYPQTKHVVSAFLRALRPYQWVKNVLVFVPLITSHNLLAAGMLARAAVAFACMSLCASAIYVVNDVVDLDSDRGHRSKRNRPFASGALPLSAGLLIAPLLFADGILLSLLLPKMATVLLLFYAVLSLAYTFWLKQKLLADVLTLSLLYTIRILEGGTAASIPVSPWLLAFSLFLLLSFAFSKRVTEMIQAAGSEQANLPGRAYQVSDTRTVTGLGIGSGYLACLVLTLYINNETVYRLYPHPAWLWLLVPLLLYWIARFWVLTTRGCISDDPIVFVFKDRVTYGTFFCGTIVLLLAMKFPFGIPGIAE